MSILATNKTKSKAFFKFLVLLFVILNFVLIFLFCFRFMFARIKNESSDFDNGRNFTNVNSLVKNCDYNCCEGNSKFKLDYLTNDLGNSNKNYFDCSNLILLNGELNKTDRCGLRETFCKKFEIIKEKFLEFLDKERFSQEEKNEILNKNNELLDCKKLAEEGIKCYISEEAKNRMKNLVDENSVKFFCEFKL